MKKHLIIKGWATLVMLSTALGVCQAREGGVLVLSPHSIMGGQKAVGNRGETPPLPPTRKIEQAVQEKSYQSLSEQVLEYTGPLTKQTLGEIQQYLDLHPDKYIIKKNVSKEEDFSIFDWYDEQKGDRNIFRFIWMSFGDTVSASTYAGLDLLPSGCIDAHVFYYQAINPH